MRDLEYHSANELEQELPHGEWVRGMRELLDLRFAFDRVSHSFRIRPRLLTERKQVLVELLAGIDATKLETSSSLPKEAGEKVHQKVHREFPGMKEEMTFDPGKNEVEEPGEGERLNLSEIPGELVLSALDSATMTCAILAKKSSGKTYLGMVLAEEFVACSGLQVPVVILDPTGVWYGLRANSDGTPSSFSLLTLGGPHADLTIGPKQGAQAAEIVHEVWPRSVLLDLSLMIPAEQHEFVADFGQRLFVLNVRSPLHLIVDEADEFAPQILNSSSRHQKRSLEVLDRIVRRGRTKGFGITLITQRSAAIAKNVISQIDSLFLLNMVAPADLSAVDDWLRYGVSAERRMECLGELSSLPPGTAYFMQNGAASKFCRFAVRKRTTFDSSRTPKPNEKFNLPVLAATSERDLEIGRKWLESAQGVGSCEQEGPGIPEEESDAEG
jgi:Predicted ATPase